MESSEKEHWKKNNQKMKRVEREEMAKREGTAEGDDDEKGVQQTEM